MREFGKDILLFVLGFRRRGYISTTSLFYFHSFSVVIVVDFNLIAFCVRRLDSVSCVCRHCSWFVSARNDDLTR